VKTKAFVYKTDTRIQTLVLKVRKFLVPNNSYKNKFFANIPKLSLKGLQISSKGMKFKLKIRN
jgi:hypothetical protein